MNLSLRYLGRSGVREGGGASELRFAPNLARAKVAFDAQVRDPIRFREAISALHDVVVGDLRFHRKDKSAYEAWKQQQVADEARLRSRVFHDAKARELALLDASPPPKNLEIDFRKKHGIYWTARRKWADELRRSDPELFRHLVPCDPVVTVAPDVVFFECFAKDESAYGCLSVDREAFVGSQEAAVGTTNVDYSLALYDHFQTLRTYRPTRLKVDPEGFDVKVEGAGDYREEKIDLPPSWLRGFGQLQGAMGLPARKVELPVEAVYSVLAHLRRHREKVGPRSLRFQLIPGKPPSLVLDPWGITIPTQGKPWDGEKAEELKIWGRRRLMSLARLLPLAERFEVHLLGTGLPSIWIARCGELRFTLALSGWTSNDWTSGGGLELLAGALREDPVLVDYLGRYLKEHQHATLAQLDRACEAPRAALLGSLHRLALQGQLVYDFAGSCYRFRQVMPVALSEAVLGPEPEEIAQGRRLAASISIRRTEPLAGGRRLLVATSSGKDCEAIIDADGTLSRATCSCSFFAKNRLRTGPCRHLTALRLSEQPRA